MNKRYWLFNTEPGENSEGAHRDMFDLSVIATWGHCRGTGARRTLDKPAEGESVFFFLAGKGIIACGEVTGRAFKATTIFGQANEYHRRVTNLRVPPTALTVAAVQAGSGYDLPCRHIVCQLKDEDGVRFVIEHFEGVPVACG